MSTLVHELSTAIFSPLPGRSCEPATAAARRGPQGLVGDHPLREETCTRACSVMVPESVDGHAKAMASAVATQPVRQRELPAAGAVVPSGVRTAPGSVGMAES